MGEAMVQTQPVDLDNLPLFITFAEAGAILGEANPTQPRRYSAWSLLAACRQLASAKGDALSAKAFEG